jgi:hypothetical protein
MLLLLSACTGSDKESGDAPPLALADPGEDCAVHAPVVTALEILDGGMATFEGVELPSILLSVDATDDDGDLDRMAADFWWDTEIDGFASAESSPDADGEPIVVRDLPCGVGSAGYMLRLPIQSGSYLEPDTDYDVAVIVSDAHAEPSEKFTITGHTPQAP